MLGYLIDLIRKSHILYLRFRANNCIAFHPQGTVLIVAPHPDDEVIGCGGLIARLVEAGNAPQIVVMTGGEGSHGTDEADKDAIVKARRGLTRKALSILGVPVGNLHELDFKDGEISAESEQVKLLKTLIDSIRPDTVLVPHWGEGWPDHVNAAKIVKALVSSSAEVWEYCVWMWYYQVWRGLDWANAASLHLSPREHELKVKAVDAYIRPLAPNGKPWSGVLPKVFIEANTGNIELYFKCGISK